MDAITADQRAWIDALALPVSTRPLHVRLPSGETDWDHYVANFQGAGASPLRRFVMAHGAEMPDAAKRRFYALLH